MHDSGFKRWMVLGALASASWLVSACGALPQQGNTFEVAPGFTRSPEQTGYNGTIQSIPTSIDPRTDEAKGTPGRSLLMDPGERALQEEREGLRLEAIAGEDAQGGSIYGGSGSEGAAPIPTERELIVPDEAEQDAASKGRSGKGNQRR